MAWCMEGLKQWVVYKTWLLVQCFISFRSVNKQFLSLC